MEELISPWQEVKTPPQPTTNTVGSFPTVCVRVVGVLLLLLEWRFFPIGSYLFRSLLVFFFVFFCFPSQAFLPHTPTNSRVSAAEQCRSSTAPRGRAENQDAAGFVSRPETLWPRPLWHHVVVMRKQTLVLKLTRAETKSKSRKLKNCCFFFKLQDSLIQENQWVNRFIRWHQRFGGNLTGSAGYLTLWALYEKKKKKALWLHPDTYATLFNIEIISWAQSGYLSVSLGAG